MDTKTRLKAYKYFTKEVNEDGRTQNELDMEAKLVDYCSSVYELITKDHRRKEGRLQGKLEEHNIKPELRKEIKSLIRATTNETLKELSEISTHIVMDIAGGGMNAYFKLEDETQEMAYNEEDATFEKLLMASIIGFNGAGGKKIKDPVEFIDEYIRRQEYYCKADKCTNHITPEIRMSFINTVNANKEYYIEVIRQLRHG